ncbi:GCN5-related N-acetyltransferase 7, chloroplastic [Henckelia pumila]|uniref:GCN5-related N-acetyltransferase 7, chloroplastic n=1 Tax=Henckelia pumila TaxID=405737 RepID=UPI003C6E4D06
MAILLPLQHSSYTYPAAAAADVFFPASVHCHSVSRSCLRYCQLSDHQTPPLSPLQPRSGTARTDRSLLNVSESCSEAELWAAANLRVRTFYEFNEQTFRIEDHKKYLADLEFEALKERVAGKKMGFRKVSCINATLPMSLVSSISHDLCTSCKFPGDEEDQVVVGTLDLNQCVSLPHEIVGMKPKTIGADFARAYLSNVCVAKEFQRNGFGHELMAKAKSVAEAWGISDLYVHVAVDNEAAKNLYLKSGFTLESDEPAWQARFLDRPRRLLLWTALPITYEL